jgi:c-di-GMP-binding flagellar brake protein YcgR
MAIQLSVNQQVLLQSDFIIKDKKVPAYIAAIEKDQIALDLKSVPVEIQAGTPITVYFWDDKSIYSFETTTLTPKSRMVTYFNIQPPQNITKSFKRNFQRIDVKMKGMLKDVDGLGRESCFITDLSASGAKTIARTGKKAGHLARISFTLPNGPEFTDIDIVIVRAAATENPRLTEYGFSFSGISRLRQDKLNDFIVNAILNDEAKVSE